MARKPDPHDEPGFNRATGVDDPTPRHEYRDEPPEHDPRDGADPGEHFRQASADELREAAEHVEAGHDERAQECQTRAGELLREARQLELAESEEADR